jgi:hypothetical protein
VRLHFVRNAGWDDVFICIAMVRSIHWRNVGGWLG